MPFSPSPGGPPSGGPGLCWPPWGWATGWSTPHILQAVEPYPGRWTHHLLLTAPEDVDGLLAAWLAEAYRFAREKQRRA